MKANGDFNKVMAKLTKAFANPQDRQVDSYTMSTRFLHSMADKRQRQHEVKEMKLAKYIA